jgi:Schlafen, AlbA_2
MPAPRSPGWALRLTELLGVRPDDATEEHLERLVVGGVREDADLDFKQQPYGNSDSQKREMAGDIAAMANDRGGLIVVGIRDENDVAMELTPVELADGEEARIRQSAAQNIAPHLTFGFRIIETEDDDTRGYYLLIVAPSTLRPHAVRSGVNLRFPRRDGTTTRWLSEPEVAEVYRDRFRLATDQTTRVSRILDQGLDAMDYQQPSAFLGVALVPTGPGAMAIDLERTWSLEQWIRDLGAPRYFDGFFDPTGSPTAGVAARRVTLMPLWDRNRLKRSEYAEFYDDGAGFACTHIYDARGPADEHDETLILNETLVWDIGRCLHVLGQHAVRNCGAWGDALVKARLVGKAMRLAFLERGARFDRTSEITGGRELGTAEGRQTIVVEAAAAVGPDLAVGTRLIATDLFHAFGAPEVRQIAPDGALRVQHLGDDGELRSWAEQQGPALSDEIVAGE